MKDKFVLYDGYVTLNNQQLFVNKKNRELKDRGGFLGILLTLICLNLYYSFRKTDFFSKISDYVSFFLQTIGVITLIYLLYYLIFRKKWSKNMFINDIEKVTLDKYEFETDVTITFSNRRFVNLEFRNLENQIEPFIDALKKRNQRILVKYNT